MGAGKGMGKEGRKRRGGVGGGEKSGERGEKGKEGERKGEGVWRGSESGLPRGPRLLSAGLLGGVSKFFR